MHYLGPYGRAAYNGMGRSPAKRLGGHLVGAAEVAAGAALAGVLTGLSQQRGMKGNTPFVPVPVPLGLALAGLLGAATLGGKAEPHLMDLTKGFLGAYAATMGLKMSYGANPAQIMGSWGESSPGALGWGYSGSLPAGAQYGATPETEALFREAGLTT